MLRIRVILYAVLVLYMVSCKTTQATNPDHYTITILLNNTDAINKVMNICVPLDFLSHEIVNEQPSGMGKVIVTASFIKKDDVLIDKVKQQLVNSKEVVTVQINKSYR